MHLQDIHFKTVEEYYAEVDGMDARVTQLSGGLLDFTGRSLFLPAVTLEWNTTGASFRCQELSGTDSAYFCFPVISSSAYRVFERECGDEMGIRIQGGLELDYVLPSGLSSLNVRVDASMAVLMGWALQPVSVHTVRKPALKKLRRVCREAFAAAERLHECGDAKNSQLDLALQKRILSALELVIQPWLEPLGSESAYTLGKRDYEKVQAVDVLLDSHALGTTVTATELAARLGISRRALFHGFRNWLGVGPMEYIQLVRLHQMRGRLLNADSSKDTIGEIGAEFGFRHGGQMAANYRDLFGENPRDTLRYSR